MGCLLPLLKDERLKGLLPGLVIKSGEISLREGEFACCGGKGIQIDPKSKGATRCDLQGRLVRVNQLAERFLASGEKNLESFLGKAAQEKYFGPAFVRLKRQLESPELKSLAFFRRSSEHHLPSPLLSLAMAAAWRLGYKIHWLNGLKCTKPENLLPDPKKITGAQPWVIFVAGVDKLWEPDAAFEFESVVSFCYRSQVPLWVEFLHKEPVTQVKASTARVGASAFSRRVKELKEKAPYSWLGDDIRYKLFALVEGISDPLNQNPSVSPARGIYPGNFSHRPK